MSSDRALVEGFGVLLLSMDVYSHLKNNINPGVYNNIITVQHNKFTLCTTLLESRIVLRVLASDA